MCAGMEGKEMMRVFAKYYSGRSVDESDSEVLDALSMTEYLEYYVCDGELCDRAGPIGRLFKNPVRFRSLQCSLRYDRQLRFVEQSSDEMNHFWKELSVERAGIMRR